MLRLRPQDEPSPKPAAAHSRHIPMRSFSGAQAARVIDASDRMVPEHSHDWPVLSLVVSGGFHNVSDSGERTICVPSAILYRRRDAHSNRVGERGFEQLEIEFDPAWLRLPEIDDSGPRHWIGGRVGISARRLATLWTDGKAAERDLVEGTRSFLAAALTHRQVQPPAWAEQVAARLRSDEPPTTAALAGELGFSAAWLTEAYRAATGEGVAEAARRGRVETAARLLRETRLPAAQVAAAAGFCDQSHMIRAFNAVLGRTPGTVRAEWLGAANGDAAPDSIDAGWGEVHISREPSAARPVEYP